MLILSFTSLPFWGYYWLGTSAEGESLSPSYIVVMGGSAIPGNAGLMRTYYAAKAAKKFPDAKIIVALPGDTTDKQSSLSLMIDELEIRGVDQNRIGIENKGTNTRYQVLEIKDKLPSLNAPLLVVTSPDHMRRALLSFEKAGFNNIDGLPAFEKWVDFNLNFEDEDLGGRYRFLPGIGDNIQIRYRFWQQLEYELKIIREIAALGYYKLKGWI